MLDGQPGAQRPLALWPALLGGVWGGLALGTKQEPEPALSHQQRSGAELAQMEPQRTCNPATRALVEHLFALLRLSLYQSENPA